jgi:hypothetical protein
MSDGKGSILPNNFQTESKLDERDAENVLSAPQTSSDVAAKTHKTAPLSSLSLNEGEGSRVREGSNTTPEGSPDVPSPSGPVLERSERPQSTVAAGFIPQIGSPTPAPTGSSISPPASGEPALSLSKGVGGGSAPNPKKRGPKTAEGKARSSRNAVKHGIRSPHPFIIEGLESPEEWEEFKLGIIESRQPVGTQELELAINVAWDHWKLRRCRMHENAVLSKQVEETEDELQQGDAYEDGLPEDAPLPPIDPERLVHHQPANVIPNGWSMDRMLRYEAQVRKALNQDMNMLEVLQARRQGERTPLARVEVNSGPTFARARNSASDIPAFQVTQARVRLAELQLAERKRAARAENAAHV